MKNGDRKLMYIIYIVILSMGLLFGISELMSGNYKLSIAIILLCIGGLVISSITLHNIIKKK